MLKDKVALVTIIAPFVAAPWSTGNRRSRARLCET
jgi:hypothetical protein